MTFEEKLRSRISGCTYGSAERNLLKVVLGELQQKGNVTDEVAHGIVKKLINSNNETLGYLKDGDPRRNECLAENKVLSSLLPQYLTSDQIRHALTEAGIDVKSMNEGQATGKAMQHFKLQNSPVEGQTVKEVVKLMRE